MACEGLKKKAREKCLKNYAKEAKNIYPKFNKETDTLIKRRSNNISGALQESPTTNVKEQKVTKSGDQYIVKTIIKKPRKVKLKGR
jgi:hypothetical protein